MWHSIIASAPTPLTYFGQSNTIGKIIVIGLMLISVTAWTVMIWKYLELSTLRKQNQSQKRTLSGLNSLCGVSIAHHPQIEATLSKVFHAGLLAYHSEVRVFGAPNTELSRDRCMKNIENAMSRCIAKTGLYYESYMVTLGSIVTAAPFLGLLGTVWGVMDAFGGVANGGSATLQHLAPGVSGALLTTVAALGVAIPSVVGYNYIVNFIKAMTIELENDASELSEQFEIEISLGDRKR
jgi:biopolymer transport protein TolQ